jgi:hypothetical protein
MIRQSIRDLDGDLTTVSQLANTLVMAVTSEGAVAKAYLSRTQAALLRAAIDLALETWES